MPLSRLGRPHCLLSASILFAALLSGRAEELKLGDTLSDAKAIHGLPRSIISAGDSSIVRYDSFQLKLEGDRIVKINPIQDELSETKQEMLDRVARERKSLGQRLLAQYRADPYINRLPAKQQLDRWLSLSRSHPELELSREIELAQKRLEMELEEKRAKAREAEIRALRDRIEELEDRVERPVVFPYWKYHYNRHHLREPHRKRHKSVKKSQTQEPSNPYSFPRVPTRPIEPMTRGAAASSAR